jgi:quinol monooxygenase YgiN
MAALELSAHLTVRPGCLEGFKRQAAECIRITREKDTHTLRYDWFLSLDGTECEVREAYTGPEGLIEHNRNILEARTKLFKDLPGPYTLVRPETRLSAQDVETICVAARQAEANTADRRRER